MSNPHTETERESPEQHKMTPEERRWRSSAENPEKLQRSLRGMRLLLGLEGAFVAAWVIAACFGHKLAGAGSMIVIIGCGICLLLGIRNTKRLLAQHNTPEETPRNGNETK